MNSIISPWVFYWIDMAGTIKILALIASICFVAVMD